MIAETDLILNKKGNIYHLDVNKDNLSETIILVGDRDRVPLISKYFDKITHRTQHREFVIHTGYLGGKYLTVMSTGMGVGCVEICLNELDAIFNIDFKTREIKKDLTSLNLIRLGTCGTIREEISVNSIIASDYGFGLDNILQYYTNDFSISQHLLLNLSDGGSYSLFSKNNQKKWLLSNLKPYIAEGNKDLRNLFNDCIHGMTATCPGFYAPQNRNLRLQNNTNIGVEVLIDLLININYNDNKIVNFEMETSALYGLSKLMGHKALTLCTVVANRITKEFSKNSEEAVDNMIKYFLDKIQGHI
jgi:uridine phosphorylase